MTLASAEAVIDRMETDEDFANRVKSVGNPEASIALLRSEGFEVTPREMRDAFLDRFGDELSQDQLDQVAGGISDDVIATGALFVALAAPVAAAAAASVGLRAVPAPRQGRIHRSYDATTDSVVSSTNIGWSHQCGWDHRHPRVDNDSVI